ncbi:MAG TPA: TetR/AcrR family transcriptional regulator [Rubrivivax sp.]|nr:TetR/AcrR family transcriptional regulator [Rubrivivax sp.]
MARERQFSEAQVLDEVADLFTSHGYQGTSLAMLLDATGLGKQSLYNCFGDKRALYLKSLDCASARYQAVQAQMQAAADGRAALQRFFDHVIGQCGSGSAGAADKGCIVAAGLLEAVDDPLVVQTLRAKWAASHELLRAAVERGQKDGSVHNPAPSAALADLLLALTAGLRVNARAGFGAARQRRTLELALAVLDSG